MSSSWLTLDLPVSMPSVDVDLFAAMAGVSPVQGATFFPPLPPHNNSGHALLAAGGGGGSGGSSSGSSVSAVSAPEGEEQVPSGGFEDFSALLGDVQSLPSPGTMMAIHASVSAAFAFPTTSAGGPYLGNATTTSCSNNMPASFASAAAAASASASAPAANSGMSHFHLPRQHSLGARPAPLPRPEDSLVPCGFLKHDSTATPLSALSIGSSFEADSPVRMTTAAMAKLQPRDSPLPPGAFHSGMGMGMTMSQLQAVMGTNNNSNSNAGSSLHGTPSHGFVPSGTTSPELSKMFAEAAVAGAQPFSNSLRTPSVHGRVAMPLASQDTLLLPPHFTPPSNAHAAAAAAAAAAAVAAVTRHGGMPPLHKSSLLMMRKAAGSDAGENSIDGFTEDEDGGAGGGAGGAGGADDDDDGSTGGLGDGSGGRGGKSSGAKRRSNTLSRAGGPRKRVLGWCLACAQAKELEERTTRDRERKFQVCNACRKTHLTNRIVPDTARCMEQLGRLYSYSEDNHALVDVVHRELIKSYSDTRISRILTLWLNTQLEYVPVTLVCDANLDELRRLPVKVRDTLRRSEGPGYNVEYIQICGQVYWCHHLHISATGLNDFNQVVVDEMCRYINKEIEAKFNREPEFKEACVAANIDVTQLAVDRHCVKVLYELQQ